MKKSMRSIGAVFAAVIMASASVSFAAIPGFTNESDQGTLTVTTSNPLQVASAPVDSPYGTPVITQIASGWVLTFTPNSDFFAAANNFGGNKSEQLTARLSFTVTLPSPAAITTTIFEDGLFNSSAPLTSTNVAVTGGLTVAEADVLGGESYTNGNLAAATTFNSVNGSWSSMLTVNGFQQSYTSYTITVDNDLLAEALAGQSLQSAFLAKKHFSIAITTDGTTGAGQPPIPEPASLGLLALGGVALFARRRR